MERVDVVGIVALSCNMQAWTRVYVLVLIVLTPPIFGWLGASWLEESLKGLFSYRTYSTHDRRSVKV